MSTTSRSKPIRVFNTTVRPETVASIYVDVSERPRRIKVVFISGTVIVVYTETKEAKRGELARIYQEICEQIFTWKPKEGITPTPGSL